MLTMCSCGDSAFDAENPQTSLQKMSERFGPYEYIKLAEAIYYIGLAQIDENKGKLTPDSIYRVMDGKTAEEIIEMVNVLEPAS